jgi:hypothetical protein
MLGDDAVGHLVKDERAEKQPAGQQAEAPELGCRNVQVKGVKLGHKRVCDESEDQEPTGMQKDRYAIDPPDLDSFTAHFQFALFHSIAQPAIPVDDGLTSSDRRDIENPRL